MAGTATTIQRPQRWDSPFGPEMTDADVKRILSLKPFSDMDVDRFPANQSLADIIKTKMRVFFCKMSRQFWINTELPR